MLTQLVTVEIEASILLVTKTQDTGISGDGSLRGELAAAASNDTIEFAPALAGQPIMLSQGELTIAKNITITGLGTRQTVIDANHASRVFEVNGNVTVLFQALTIAHGRATDAGTVGGMAALGGGLLDNGGTVNLTAVAVQSNSAIGGPGQDAQGGGIYSSGGTLSLNGCVVSVNAAQGGLGRDGINGANGTSLTSGKPSGSPGGAGDRGGDAQGGGLYVASGTLTLTGTSLTLNTAHAGSGGQGGSGGAGAFNNIRFGQGGHGGAGGPGGDVEGGGLYFAGSALNMTGGTVAANAAIAGSGGSGGSGGAGSRSSNYGGSGGAGGVGGRAGASWGGGLYSIGGTLNLTSVSLNGNNATGALGGSGGVGGMGGHSLGGAAEAGYRAARVEMAAGVVRGKVAERTSEQAP